MRSPFRLNWLRAFLCLTGVFFGAECTKEEKEAEVMAKKPEVPAAWTTLERRTMLKASQDDCVGRLVLSNNPKEISFRDYQFKLDGYLLTQLNKDPDEQTVVGILSDTKVNSKENQRNLDMILDFFEKEKVEVILHLGDVASTVPMPDDIDVPEKDSKGKPLSDEEKERYRRRFLNKARQEAMAENFKNIVAMVSILAESELPVFVIIGNRECKTTFNSAMAALSEDFPNVFNLNMIRRVDLDDLDIISMPGYHDPEYVHCTWDKCLYYESDTLSIVDLAREANDPVLLVSHGPPRQKDRNGIDVVSEGANVGNPWLASAIEKASIPFGSFGNIQEAGGKATNLDGTSIIAQDTYVDSLFLNPGPADSMIWTMNDGTESSGMAAVFQLVGKKAKFKIFRLSQEAK